MGQSTYLWHLSLCQSKTEWDIATSMCALTAQMTPLYRVKIRELWSINSRENGAHLYTFYDMAKLAYFVKYLRIYWTDFYNLFII